MNPTDNLVAFLGLYSSGEETFENIDKDTKEILTIEEKEQKKVKEERKERWKKIRDARAKERKENRKKRNPLNLIKKFWGNRKKNEDEGMSLVDKILLGLGLAAAGKGFVDWATGDSESARAFREKLAEWAEWLKDNIKKAVQEGIDQLVKHFQDYANSLGDAFKGMIDENVIEPFEDAVNNNIRNPLQNLVGGSGYTTRPDGKGVSFNYTDVVNLRNKQADFMASTGVSGAEANAQINKFADLMEQMKKAKTANDRLYVQKKELEQMRRLRKQYEKSAPHRLSKMDQKIREQEQKVAEYEAKDKQQDAMVTALWRKLNISDRDLQLIQKRQTGGTITVPGHGSGDKVPMMLPSGSFVLNRNASSFLGFQTGGPITVPGSGSGDKVPMMLPSGSFVLNRNASSFLGFQTGGEVKEATDVLKKDEALSSLTKGVNDYVKPGGRAVRSGTPWDSITPKTPIHAYTDSVGVATIGWGSTYYDNIMSGKKPVRIGDTITKKKADDILDSNVAKLAKTYKAKMKYWNMMTEKQKAGLLSLGYNAPNAPIGSYRNLTAALNRGDMVAAAKESHRGGPSAHRLAEEKRLILSGPKDLTEVKPKEKVKRPTGTSDQGTVKRPTGTSPKSDQSTPSIQPAPKEDKGILGRIGVMFNNMFNRSEQKNVTPVRRQVGGAVNGTQSRFKNAQSAFAESVGEKMSPHVVVVKRRPQTPMVTGGDGGENTLSDGGVNIVELADKLHRIHSGAKF